MTTTPSPDVTSTTERDERKRRKAAIAKYSLAGVALLGIGAALTSAAWTDDAWFTASASAVDGGDIELLGGLSADKLVEADDVSGAVNISVPANQLAGFVPGETRDVTLYLHNDGELPLSVTGTFAKQTAGGLFDGPKPVEVSLLNSAGTEPLPGTSDSQTVGPLAPDAGTTVVLRLAAPHWTNADTGYFGATGDMTVTFTGTVTN
ncbi:hypothetical protein GC089_11210 [Cellulomonas sp. JZ18]|uniref:hypothetical protein n=1 Tax=Cellulomonas sp. JZ18 TaxID=2654191 RepID=UPI0012D38606|nr:hypothetical protein [Cellulomonas sp. JZ18]QGQ19691.1 hypothetical protein GC089_11210 [Cellulomonas sp. JZ18]